jgi:hypothetical protein
MLTAEEARQRTEDARAMSLTLFRNRVIQAIEEAADNERSHIEIGGPNFPGLVEDLQKAGYTVTCTDELDCLMYHISWNNP